MKTLYLKTALAPLLILAGLGAAPAHDHATAEKATPTELLSEEHRVVERVADVLDRMADETEKSGRLDAESGAEAVDFLKGFLDKCHHAKEEQLLFPALKKQDKEAKTIRTLKGEHDEGRAHARAMAKAVKTAGEAPEAAARSFVEHARAYTRLLREHIEREDEALFPAADRTLTPEAQRELAEGFERVEEEETGEGVHEKYLGIVERLEARYGTSGTPDTHTDSHAH